MRAWVVVRVLTPPSVSVLGGRVLTDSRIQHGLEVLDLCVDLLAIFRQQGCQLVDDHPQGQGIMCRHAVDLLSVVLGPTEFLADQHPLEGVPSPTPSSDDPESPCWSLCLFLAGACSNRATHVISSSADRPISSAFFWQVVHPTPPCRLFGHRQRQTPPVTGRLDLFWLGV
jgi:hypothetical protein